MTWLMRPPAPQSDRAAAARSDARGYYINDAVFSGFDESGQVVYRLAASRIEGFQDSNVLELKSVEIRYASDLEVPWLIRAQSALRQSDDDVLELQGVTIENTAEDPDEQTRIEADDIVLAPNRRLASSSGPVRFAIGTSTIEAVGLTADLQEEKILLESRVYGRVTP